MNANIAELMPSRGDQEPPSLTLDRLDEISDFFAWDTDNPKRFLESVCFCGTHDPTFLHDTETGEPSEVATWFRGLLEFIRREHPQGIDFQVIYQDAYVFRVHRDYTSLGVQLCIRRAKETVPLLLGPPRESLIFQNTYWPHILMSERLLKGGIILFASKPGSGKSTTMGATVRSRLERFSGFGKSIEAPPELPLSNCWGRGMFFQTAVDENLPLSEQYSKPLRAIALRGFPAIPGGGRTLLMLGEIRDKETAALTIQTSVGHLMLTSIHGEDPAQAVGRLASMAGEVLGEKAANDMLASALRVVVSQELLVNPSKAQWNQRIIGGEILWSSSYNSEAAGYIRKGDFAALNNVVKQQRQMMEAGAGKVTPSDMLQRLSKEAAAA